MTARLAQQRIAVWDGDNYAYELMRRYGLSDSGGAVRASIVLYTTAAEIDRLVQAVATLAGERGTERPLTDDDAVADRLRQNAPALSLRVRRVTVVETESVAGRIQEDGLVADTAVDHVRDEADALSLQLRPSRGDVVDLERDRHPVRVEFLAEGRGIHDGDGQVAGLELGRRHLTPPLYERQTKHGAVEVHGILNVLRGDGDEVDASDDRCGRWCGTHDELLRWGIRRCKAMTPGMSPSVLR